MLIKSKLPLPEGLRQMGAQISSRRFREAVEAISDHTATGGDMATAMKQYPQLFPKLHIHRIAAGGTHGALDHVLFAIANFRYFNAYLLTRTQHIFAVPGTDRLSRDSGNHPPVHRRRSSADRRIHLIENRILGRRSSE